MKKFFVFIGKLLVIIVFSAILLDAFYTFIYLQTQRRNKIEYVMNTKNKSYDVLFLGSSRTHNHMVAKIFNDKGIKAYNFALSGSRLNETSLILKLLLERNCKIKNVFVDVDLNINSNSISEGTRALFLPYLHYSKTIRNHYKNSPEYNKWLYIPFYRYIENDTKIGFREIFFSLVKKRSNVLDNFGYYPLMNKGKNLSLDMADSSPKRNFDYEEIKSICKKHHINFIPIAMPVCQNCKSDTYFNSLKSVYPEIYNYENKVTDDRYFSSCGHMNIEGATVFTTIILNDFIKHKFNN